MAARDREYGRNGNIGSFRGGSRATGINDDDPQSGNLQLVRLGELLKEYDAATRSFVNTMERFIVVAVNSDKYGGADLSLSGGYHLQIFPDGSDGEWWRFIDIQGRHVVVEADQTRIDEWR